MYKHYIQILSHLSLELAGRKSTNTQKPLYARRGENGPRILAYTQLRLSDKFGLNYDLRHENKKRKGVKILKIFNSIDKCHSEWQYVK